MLQILPCVDSAELAARWQRELNIDRDRAAELGRSAYNAGVDGSYTTSGGRRVDWLQQVQAAKSSRVSIPPTDPLPNINDPQFAVTTVQVANETTLAAGRRLVDGGKRPLALNFANGIHPGGGFFTGARAQEEVLCRSSALFSTLYGDPMYPHHHARTRPDSTDWCILSPDVPVFRTDDGTDLDEPWLLSFISSASPVVGKVSQTEARVLLKSRINRVLAVARAYGFTELVLGAWGCGAFHNDPATTAEDFLEAIEGPFSGAFREIVFAITDWSPERKFLGPFRTVFR
jgi:uncharacterized protein (TIGR02452 family)